MTRVHNRFSSYRLFAGRDDAVARLYAGLAKAVRRRLGYLWLTAINDLRNREDRLSWSRLSTSRRLPGSVFDARYAGLTAQAAHLDAAICRRQRLFQPLTEAPDLAGRPVTLTSRPSTKHRSFVSD
jgi:hypothetical protein